MTTPVHFIITGGTIDSYYDGTKDTVVPSAHSVIPSFIQSLKLYTSSIFTELCMKDSRELTTDDLGKIVGTVEQSSSTNVIITHGTYTMPDTARYLKAHLRRKDQTVVLTGSMIPIVGFAPSDGPFHLGYAVAQVQSLSPGIYLCMNGKTFSPDEVMKVSPEGRFRSIFGE